MTSSIQNIPVKLNQSPVKSSSLTGLTSPQGLIKSPIVSAFPSLNAVPSLDIPKSPPQMILSQIPGFPPRISSVGTVPPTLVPVQQSPTNDVSQLLSNMSPVPSPPSTPPRTPPRTPPVQSTSPVRLPTVSPISPIKSLPSVRLPTVSPTSPVKLSTVTSEVRRSGIGLSTSAKSYGTPGVTPLFKTPSQLSTENRISSVSSAKPQFSTLSAPIPSPGVESQLFDKGYVTTDRILTKTPTGGVEGRYLKAINERGQTVFVELDTDGFVSVQPEDLTMIVSKRASKIPVSVKTGAMECAGSDVCGVAFECNGEVCTLTREDPSMAPSELVLHSVSKSTERSVVEEGTPIAYPLVRLSEIITDNSQVVQNVDAATSRIRNASYNACVEDMRKTNEICDEMKAKFKVLVGTIDVAFQKLGTSIKELECYRVDYDNIPPQNDEQKEKYHKLAFNLRRRHDMMVDLLRICSQVSGYGDQLKFTSDKFDEFTQHIDEAYKGLDFVYQE